MALRGKGSASRLMEGIDAIARENLSPDLEAERRAVYNDPVESDESDIDEEETLLDHAPNWANGADADRRQGLRATAAAAAAAAAASSSSGVRYDGSEECKLVLVVRTDLGMTKGSLHPFSSRPLPFPSSPPKS
jgi:PTH2 family peptidyl-tRNA hydrolase